MKVTISVSMVSGGAIIAKATINDTHKNIIKAKDLQLTDSQFSCLKDLKIPNLVFRLKETELHEIRIATCTVENIETVKMYVADLKENLAELLAQKELVLKKEKELLSLLHFTKTFEV